MTAAETERYRWMERERVSDLGGGGERESEKDKTREK